MKSKKPQKATPALIKGLSIIRDYEVYMPSQFARLFWGSDHAGWTRHGKAGPNGSAGGVGMRLAGGALLGKWRKWGLITAPHISHPFGPYNKYKLTGEGDSYLNEALREETGPKGPAGTGEDVPR